MNFQARQQLGTILLNAGKIDEDQLQAGLRAKQDEQGYIGETFINLGYINERDLNRYLSYQLKIPYLQLAHYQIDKSLMDLFPERVIRTKGFLPLFRLNNTINIAVSDPMDSDPINTARDISGLKVELVIALASEIDNAIDLHYGISGFVDVDSPLRYFL